MNVYSGMYRWTRTLAFLDESKFDILSNSIYVFTYLRIYVSTHEAKKLFK